MILFDTNVLLDIATADPTWLKWSENEFRNAAAQGLIAINPVIYAELAPAFSTVTDLDQWLDPAVFYDCHCLIQQDGLPHKLSSSIDKVVEQELRLCPTFTLEHTPKSKGTRSSLATQLGIVRTFPK